MDAERVAYRPEIVDASDVLAVGQKIEDGSFVLDFAVTDEYIAAITFQPESELPFISWTGFRKVNGNWGLHSSRYYEDLESAIKWHSWRVSAHQRLYAL